MEYHYRRGTVADKEKLQQLGLNSYGQFKNILTEENWNKLNSSLTTEKTYLELLSISTCYVCEKGEEIVGMAFIIPSGNPTDIFDENWSYIRMGGVHTDYAGNGIGKRLTQMCIDHAKKRGEKIVALHTSEFMDAARKIYEKMGFKQIKELPFRLGKRYWLYHLKLQ